MEDEPLHLTISYHYLWELSIAHTPASVHFVYCSRMYQLSISAKCTIKYSCLCCVEMPETHFTKDYLLCFLRNALQAFDHWTTGEKAAVRKWLSNMSTTSAKAPYSHTCWLKLRGWHNSQQLFSLKYLFVNVCSHLPLPSHSINEVNMVLVHICHWWRMKVRTGDDSALLLRPLVRC